MVKNREKITMSYPRSQAYRLLGLIALCGELPADAIRRLPISGSYRYKVIASLKSQKLILSLIHI